MKIRRVYAENYKGFNKVDLYPGDLNMIVGSNSSGKSRIISLINFINNIIKYDLDDAIMLEGGIDYIRNRNNNSNTTKLLYELDLSDEEKIFTEIYRVGHAVFPKIIHYEIELSYSIQKSTYKIKSEFLKLYFDSIVYKKKKIDISKNFEYEVYKNSDGNITDNYNDSLKTDKEKENIFSMKSYSEILNTDNDLLIRNLMFIVNLFSKQNEFIKLYNFDTYKLKQPGSIIGTRNLNENGDNLTCVLNNLLKNPNNKKKMTRLFKAILPFVENISIDNTLNRTIYFKIKEKYNDEEYPSYILSDGTVNIIAIIIALYFNEDSNILIFEEPDNNIHPKILDNLMKAFSETSKKTQIFITTHNPTLVEKVKVDDLYLVSRDYEGNSYISKPIDNEIIQTFIENELGIGTLFVDGML